MRRNVGLQVQESTSRAIENLGGYSHTLPNLGVLEFFVVYQGGKLNSIQTLKGGGIIFFLTGKLFLINVIERLFAYKIAISSGGGG